ncbi:MAG: glucosamine inositolphosphorylceramide transferase family protein [Geminicoccaceae bacterium]
MSKLRIGLVVGPGGLKAWHEQVLTILDSHGEIDLLGVYTLPEEDRSDAGRASRAHPSWQYLDRIETAVARRLFKTPDALAPLDLSRVGELPPRHDIVDLGNEAASVPIPDLLIQLDDFNVDPALAAKVDHGLWRLSFDGLNPPLAGIGVQGWRRGQHVIDVTLWQVGGPTKGEETSGIRCLIERAHLGVFKQSWSINRSRLLWKAALMIADNAIRLATATGFPGGSSGQLASTDSPSPSMSAVDDAMPGAASLGLLWLRRVVDHIWYKLVYVEQWQILATETADDMLKPETYARLQPPKDRFWADPFAVRREDKDYIFVEELRFTSGKGEIAVLEHRDGKLLDATTIITEPYHMSYPFVFEHDEDLYMVPETRQNRSIEIWKNTSFPNEWTKVGSLMSDVSAGDTTLFRHDGRWWMFTNLSRTKRLRSADELHAFFTDDPSPLGATWQPHRQNPLVRDTRFARQGGRVFEDAQGRLIRCAQDTAVRYGYAVLFFHVEDLSPTSFTETLLHKAEPDWRDDVVGMHTFERRGDLCIFDACFMKTRLSTRF